MGDFNDKCAFRARCNPSNDYNGGCGAGGTCTQQIPTVSTSHYTGLLNGTGFESTHQTGKIVLPTTPQLVVPPYYDVGFPIVAWYLAACFVPAGAIQSIPYNVKPLEDMLVIFKEPTQVLVTSWFQYNVQELRFTQPQQGIYGTPIFSTGTKGDMFVLKLNTCTGSHLVQPLSYSFTN